MSTTTIDPNATLGDLVVASPRRARVFEELRLDYCCGGRDTLADASRRRGLDPDTVVTVLAALDAEAASAGGAGHDVDGATISELCDHVVAAHHDRLRSELPRISELLATVVRVHGADHAELHDVERTFSGMRGELERHIATEETTLFPACRALEQRGDRLDEALIASHEGEHAEVGDALATLRSLSGDYRTENAFCNTHRVLLEAMHEIERDTHQHVHEENNVLFPRVRELMSAS